MSYELRIERLIDAPPEVVFDTFVDPEAQRFLYDDGTDPSWVVRSELDMRLGGTWTIWFGRSEEPLNRETNTFRELDRPRRIVFDSTMYLADEQRSFDTEVTVTFEHRAGSTLLTLVQSGFERREDRDLIEGGWPTILDLLGSVVTGDVV